MDCKVTSGCVKCTQEESSDPSCTPTLMRRQLTCDDGTVLYTPCGSLPRSPHSFYVFLGVVGALGVAAAAFVYLRAQWHQRQMYARIAKQAGVGPRR